MRILLGSCLDEVQLWSVVLLLRVLNNEEMHIQEGAGQDIWVVAGTVFLDVLIWKCSHGAAESDGTVDQSCPPLYCLKGHKGSIHRYCTALGSPVHYT